MCPTQLVASFLHGPANTSSTIYLGGQNSVGRQVRRLVSLSSKDRFEHAIAYVWNVREAWKQVASETHPDQDIRQDMRAIEEKALLPVLQGTRRSAFEGDQPDSCRWMA